MGEISETAIGYHERGCEEREANGQDRDPADVDAERGDDEADDRDDQEQAANTDIGPWLTGHESPPSAITAW